MKKIILLFAAAAIVFAGCTEKEETTASSIELSVESIPAGPEGGTFEIQITSSEDWRISGKTVDWMSLSADGGKSGESLSVIVSPNSTMESKSAEFKIFAGSVAKTVTVTSSPLYVIELLDDAEVDVVSGGGSVNYSINTNVPEIEVGFSGDGASWITYEKRSDAFGKTVLSFTVAESEIYKSRSSEVTLTGAGVSATFTLIQAKVDAIISELEGNRLETDLDEQDVKFSVRHNVELDDLALPEWIELKGTDTQPTAEDGLQTSELTFHLDEAPATRVGTLSFTYNGSEYLSFVIRQQNPNPVMTEIPDEGLRMELADLGWVIAEKGLTSCEIIAAGMTSESLSLEYNWGGNDINSISGLGAFPELSDISISGYTLDVLDLSDCSKINSLYLSTEEISEVHLGNNPLTKFSIYSDAFSYLSNTSLTITGTNVKVIDVNMTESYYATYYEHLATLDVTGCTNLTELHAKREVESYDYGTGQYTTVCVLETIYVTAEQKAAIDAGTLTVEKSDMTSIVVK